MWTQTFKYEFSVISITEGVLEVLRVSERGPAFG